MLFQDRDDQSREDQDHAGDLGRGTALLEDEDPPQKPEDQSQLPEDLPKNLKKKIGRLYYSVIFFKIRSYGNIAS